MLSKWNKNDVTEPLSFMHPTDDDNCQRPIYKMKDDSCNGQNPSKNKMNKQSQYDKYSIQH